jgi:hypothetical protein
MIGIAYCHLTFIVIVVVVVVVVVATAAEKMARGSKTDPDDTYIISVPFYHLAYSGG